MLDTVREIRNPIEHGEVELPLDDAKKEFGLIGGLAPIPHYDRRMDARRALDLRTKVTQTLVEWGGSHGDATFILGKDYLPAVNRNASGVSA